ncbi:hypothetical protein HBI70_198880 [Parastagonospora nodorum]|nr:hypothetical protein HBH53_191160 [Parastagonospora nodorum]KAH4018828.1 hypothetical protein HBI09_190140 [Parastagonospora nodorum]KAH4061700.1 hypothetical protein HBH50_219320 [Parastagonospora nodorum]KAH4080044.1 hypothetical protein HBH48_211140 [Parastagonospora nodorum]KAH4115520.1 hypothetical protein HBH47_182460 [Parastagonospora nodorum]
MTYSTPCRFLMIRRWREIRSSGRYSPPSISPQTDHNNSCLLVCLAKCCTRRQMSITSSATTNTGNRVGQQLTESVLTLQQTIRNVKEDVAKGIAPSILLPVDSTQDINSGMVLLTLEPSTADITAHLTPLDIRLGDLKSKLRDHRLWNPPAVPPKSPEYSIIDISDLSSAVSLLEDLFQQHASSMAKRHSARVFFSKYDWTWDVVHREFCTRLSHSAYIYLSLWRLDEQRQIWEYVSMHGMGLQPEIAADMLGCWEDWTWDPAWKEWCLDVSSEEGRCRLYASRWEVRQETDPGEPWVYVGGHDDQ